MDREGEVESGGAEAETSCISIERLGKERPEIITSRWVEVGYCFSIAMSQILVVCRFSAY